MNFYDTAKVDDLFDGKTINMLESFKSFNQSEGILVSIFSLLICFIMSILTYQFIFNEQFRTFPINEILKFKTQTGWEISPEFLEISVYKRG